jgi:hypothetical protein
MRVTTFIFILVSLIAGPLFEGNPAWAATDTVASGSAYEAGRRAMDRAEWQEAREAFERAARAGASADAALYWKAYSEMKLKDFTDAKETIARLRAAYPQSRWTRDADALELEMRGPHGGDQLPEDEEMKLYALQMLMMNDPKRAEPLLRQYIEEGGSDNLRERAMFILLNHPDAAHSDLLSNALAPGINMNLKMSAIRLLGVLDDPKSRELLDRAYEESTKAAVKHMIIQAYMTQGNIDRLAEIALTEQNVSLQRQAVTMLGVSGEIGRVRDLYQSTDDTGIRRAMMQGFAMAGEGDVLLEVLESETDSDLRKAAINHLVMVRSPDLGERLMQIYTKSTDAQEKGSLLRTLAMKGESDALISLYRGEQDIELRRQILQSMAMFMNNARVADFFEEILQEAN